MRAKTAKTPVKSRKVSERAKTQAARSDGQENPSSEKPSVGSEKPSGGSQWPLAIVVGMICIVGGAALIMARQPGHRDDAATVKASLAATPGLAVSSSAHETTKPAAAKSTASATRKTSKMEVSRRSGAPATAAEKTTEAASTAKEPAADPQPKMPPPDKQSQSEFLHVTQVTVTGCLERRDDEFWLADTAGADAPRSRSWKTGFLTKRSSPVQLVDGADTLKLRSYVGQRVSATGMLADRVLQAHALRRVAASCD